MTQKKETEPTDNEQKFAESGKASPYSTFSPRYSNANPSTTSLNIKDTTPYFTPYLLTPNSSGVNDNPTSKRATPFQRISTALPRSGPRRRGKQTTLGIEDFDLDYGGLLSRISDQHRDEWTGRLDFNMACLGYIIGLGNFAKFPMLVFKNGGGGFIIPYLIMVIFVGLPIFYLELALGQYTSLGPTKCWEFCPIAAGVGYAIAFCNLLSTIWYIIVISWAALYFVLTFYKPLPWGHCGEWSSKNCIENVLRINQSECLAKNGIPCQPSKPCDSENPCFGGFGSCQIGNGTDQIVLWNTSLASSNGCKITTAAYEYYIKFVTGNPPYNMTNLGEFNQELLLSFFISWVFIALFLVLGIRFGEKFSVITIIIQYIALPVLFIKGLLLDGAQAGISLYLTTHIDTIFRSDIWVTAAKSVFLGNSLMQGGLINLASYRKFHNSCLGDAILNIFSDTFVGLWAGFIVFSFLGFLARYEGVHISVFTTEGLSLVFGVFTSALALMPYYVLYHVTFYSLLIVKGLGSQMVQVDIINAALLDEWPSLHTHPRIFICGVCFAMFLLGLPLTAFGGDDIISLINDSITDIYLICGIMLCVTIGWCYKAKRFIKDTEIMLGYPHNFICKWFFIISWKFTIPVVLVLILIVSCMKQPLYPDWPTWLYVIRWLITSVNFATIFGVGLHRVLKTEGSGFQKIKNATKPTKFWGPAKLHDRHKVQLYNKA